MDSWGRLSSISMNSSWPTDMQATGPFALAVAHLAVNGEGGLRVLARLGQLALIQLENAQVSEDLPLAVSAPHLSVDGQSRLEVFARFLGV